MRTYMMKDISILIPELAEWNNGNGIDVYSWISGVGQYDHAIGYTTIFWPSFSVYDDCVFRFSVTADIYKQWSMACNGEKESIEISLNHLHIMDLFPNSEFQPEKEAILYIGSVLEEMWSCKLNKDFPERKFVVKFPYGEVVELVDYQITFFQKRLI